MTRLLVVAVAMAALCLAFGPQPVAWSLPALGCWWLLHRRSVLPKDAFGPPGVRVAIPEWVRLAVYRRDGWRCSYCGQPVHREAQCLLVEPGCRLCAAVDHVVPLAQRGANALGNLATACSACNRSKGARRPEEWLS